MNTELLREDELWAGGAAPEAIRNFAELLRGRLIEERKKNAFLLDRLGEERDRSISWRLQAERESETRARAEAELAEARKDSERLDWLFKVGDAAQHSRAAIDAAMKECHNL